MYLKKNHPYCDRRMKDTDRRHSAGIIQNSVIIKQVVPEICVVNTTFYLSIIHLTGIKTSFVNEILLMIKHFFISPTDALFIALKLKFTLKFSLKLLLRVSI